jgi:hypothetical protein
MIAINFLRSITYLLEIKYNKYSEKIPTEPYTTISLNGKKLMTLFIQSTAINRYLASESTYPKKGMSEARMPKISKNTYMALRSGIATTLARGE